MWRAALSVVVCLVSACTLTFDRDRIVEETDSCLGTNPGAEIFRDDFDGTLTQWNSMSGMWALGNSELEQQAVMDSATILSGQNMGADYRVVAQLRMLAEGRSGGAMEIVTRAASPAASYHCNWEPETGEFEIQDSAISMPLVQRTITLSDVPGYVSTMPVIMEMQVQGTDIRCCIRDLPLATLNLSNSAYTTGTVGFQTWFMSAAFDSLRVYEAR